VRQRSFLILLLFLIASGWGCDNRRPVCIKDACIRAEVARSPQQKAEGLMFRKKLSKDEGMLFVFDQDGIYPFWMKNMNFSLDILWVNQEGQIVEIRKNVPACSLDCEDLIPQKKARYVLEVCAGFTDAHGIEVGERLRF